MARENEHPSPDICVDASTHLSSRASFALVPLLLQADGIDVAGGTPEAGGLGAILPVLVGVIILAGLAAGGYFGFKWFKENIDQKSPPAGHNPFMNRETMRRIDKAMAASKFEEAGDLLARAQRHGDAGEAYAKGGSHLKAARSFLAGNNRAQAVHHFKHAGEFLQAARIYAEDGKARAAAAEYLQAGEHELAAEQYAIDGDVKRAAENYDRAESYELAGQYYEKAEMPLKAAQSYSKHLEDVFADAKGDPEAIASSHREIARRTGDFFRDSGELELASDVFRSGGFFEEAAECLRVSGDYSRAAQMLIDVNRPLLAAKILEEAGEERRAALMRAEEAERTGDDAAAAKAFFDAGDYRRAAVLFEGLGELGRAAALYEELEEYERATELFIKAGKVGNAARCAEAGGHHAQAAELYEESGDFQAQLKMLRRLGDFFRAGRLLFEHRQFDDALKVLSNIDSADAFYSRSIELQGDILRAQGRHEKAYSRYRAALGTREADIETLPLFYKMARALEDVQDLAGAMQNYTIVVDLDEHHEDAALRLKALRERQRRGKRNTSSGLFNSPKLDGDGAQRYEVLEEIARGGMGIVYKARDTVLGRIVAYKVLGENLRDNETAVKYFLREARAAAALSHPNIVTIFDAGEQDGDYYMAMEFVEGTTLKDLIRRTGALPDEQVRYILANSCRALHYAHSKGIIHRDIKSGNVMITRDKTLKVMDFGLAKFLREYQNNHTQQVGTPFYMSPEQIIGKDIDFRSDLYSLGCMLYECATGTVPFYKGDLSYHHLHTKPVPPRSINPVLSKELEGVILRLLAKSPDDRYQSAAETGKAL